jgi:flagellar basal body-associated protein FliL
MHTIIHEASVTGLFRLILIVLTVYVVYTLLIRYIFPSLLRKYVTDFQKQFTGENQHRQEEQNPKKEGEISIKYINKDKNTTNNPPDDGDYVDYEEIK